MPNFAVISEVNEGNILQEMKAVYRIMSLHKSKGLSSPVVVIAGCIEGLLLTAPDQDKSPQEQQADLEEQRRLLYVGLARKSAAGK